MKIVVSVVALAAALAFVPTSLGASHAEPTLRSTAPSGDYPITIVASPDGSSAYATNYYDDTVSMFARGADGDLSPLGAVPAGDVPWHAAISGDGSSAYVTNYGDDSISMYARNAAGVLTPLAPATIGTSLADPTTIVLSPDGKNAYVVNEGDSSLTVFNRDTATGALTFAANHASADVTMGLAISPDGLNLYLGACAGAQIAVVERDPVDGSLSGDFESGFTVSDSPRSFTMSPDGAQLYAANEAANSVAVYTRDASDGSLANGPAAPTLPIGASPRSIAFTSTGSHGYVAYRAANQIGVFARSAVDGELTHVRDIATGEKPTSVTVSTDETLYSADTDNDRISTFQLTAPTVDLAIGVTGLTLVNGSVAARFDVDVSNREPILPSAGTTVTAQLPADLAFDAGASSAGCVAASGGTVTCTSGVLAAGRLQQFRITATPTRAGTTITTFRVTGTANDVRTANNTASVSISVPPTAFPRTPANLCPAGTSAGVRCDQRAGGGLTITGTARGDVIVGTKFADLVLGGGGNDRITLGGGHDRANGQAGNDVIVGGAGNDRLLGGTGTDRLVGDAGNDMLVGQSGNDRLIGGAGRDALYGGLGRDLLDSADGGTRDAVSGGFGIDRGIWDTADRVRLVERGSATSR